RESTSLRQAAEIECIAFKTDRDAARGRAFAGGHRADGPVSRPGEQIRAMQKKVGDPGANAALELPLQRRSIRDPLARSGRAASRLEKPDSLASQDMGRSRGDAVDPFA